MKKEKITTIIIAIVLLFSFTNIAAHGEETFSQAEEIIEQKVPCEDLTDEQLEAIGDYYMEQIHPGEEHEYMDEMMGGESSETLKVMHINMAESFYCGEHSNFDYDDYSMYSMMNNYPEGMMRRNMMNYYSLGYRVNPLNTFAILVLVAGIFILTIWLIKNRKQTKKSRRKKK